MNEPIIEPAIDLSPRRVVTPARYPTPNNPPWNILVAIGVWILSVILILFLPMLFVTPYVINRGIDLGDRESLMTFLSTDPTAVVLRLAPMILAHAFTLLVAWFVVTRFSTFSFRQTLGWEMNGFKIWHAFVITIACYGIGVVLVNLFGDVDSEFKMLVRSSRQAVYLVAFFATFTAPLVEEVVYRGLLYSALRRRLGVSLAVVAVTLLFAGVHVPQYSREAVPDYAAVGTLLFVSLVLTVIRARTDNLLPCIVVHTIFNSIGSALLLAEPYLRSLQPVVEPTTGFFLK